MAFVASMKREDKPRSGLALGGLGTGWFELRKDGCFYYSGTPAPDALTFQNNIFVTGNRPFSYINPSAAAWTHKNNIYWRTDNNQSIGIALNTSQGEKNTDPQFENMAGKDLRLKSTSPARDAGLSTGLSVTDFAGNAVAGIVDIGAYEYLSTAIKPGRQGH